MHPEVAFWALNQNAPMKYNKRKEPGLDERLTVLELHYTESATCFENARRAFMKSEVANDDIVDAMVGAVTAMKGHQFSTLPAEPFSDDEGLTMEMVFANC
jgi:predicted RNase H-like nuclease